MANLIASPTSTISVILICIFVGNSHNTEANLRIQQQKFWINCYLRKAFIKKLIGKYIYFFLTSILKSFIKPNESQALIIVWESQTDNGVFRLQSIDLKKPQRQSALSSRRNPLHILTLTQGILQIHYQPFYTKDLRWDLQQEVRSRQIWVCFPFKQD